MGELCWPNVGMALRCKANTIKDVAFHLAYVNVGPTLALRCVPNVNYQPTVQRFANFMLSGKDALNPFKRVPVSRHKGGVSCLVCDGDLLKALLKSSVMASISAVCCPVLSPIHSYSCWWSAGFHTWTKYCSSAWMLFTLIKMVDKGWLWMMCSTSLQHTMLWSCPFYWIMAIWLKSDCE